MLKARSVAGSCNAASGSLVDVDIPELSGHHGLVLTFSVPAWDWGGG